MDKNKVDEATKWLQNELNKFGLGIPEERVKSLIEGIVKIFEKQ